MQLDQNRRSLLRDSLAVGVALGAASILLIGETFLDVRRVGLITLCCTRSGTRLGINGSQVVDHADFSVTRRVAHRTRCTPFAPNSGIAFTLVAQ